MYLSVVFSWQLQAAKALAKSHDGSVMVGGPAAVNNKDRIEWADVSKSSEYDVLSFHNPLATFTTRGCPRSCHFCTVPKIEGQFRELRRWKPNPVICDNNILAASDIHIEKVIDRLLVFPYVDFNQGLDARLFREFHAYQLARLQKVKVRFALDDSKHVDAVWQAVALARSCGLKDINVYVLIGYKDTPEDALQRLELVRSWGLWPNPMRFQPLDAAIKNSYVAPGWNEKQLRQMMRYYSRLRWLEHVPFADYQKENQLSLLEADCHV